MSGSTIGTLITIIVSGTVGCVVGFLLAAFLKAEIVNSLIESNSKKDEEIKELKEQFCKNNCFNRLV